MQDSQATITSMETTDAQLVGLSQGGDTAAFGELVRRYQGLIHGVAYHRVGSFTDAQDIAQESFVKAYRCLDQLTQPERFAAWLKTITANECKMWMRGSKRSLSLDEPELLPSLALRADESWRRKERQTEVRQAVSSLPEKSRLIVTLHYLSGLSHQEIGEFLEIAANAVSQHLHRARGQLREALMAGVEEEYIMNKLPESFTEEVLGRIVLYPIVEGVFMTSQGEGNTRGITLAIPQPDSEKSYITFWTNSDDLNEIIIGTLPARTSENAKGRALDSCLSILSSFGIDLKRVVLRLMDGRKCRADVEFVQGKKSLSVDIRPSDAMGLAVRVGVPILAEESVIRRGNVGEDNVPVPDEDMDPALHNEEYQKMRLCDIITDKAFEMVSTEDWVDTIRFHQDEAESVLRVWPEAIPEREITFDLKEYSLGVQMIFDHAQRRSGIGKMIGGEPGRGWKEQYEFLFTMLGEDARMRVVREDEPQTD